MPSSPKSADLTALVERLCGDLGDGYFVEVPYWDGDQRAIGLGHPADPRFPVYLCVQPGDAGVYLECEVPAGRDEPDALYGVAGSGIHASYGQILAAVSTHLAR